MVTRRDQIKRVVKIMEDNYGEWDMGWERYYDLEIYPIENDLYEETTDDMIRLLLKEEPQEEPQDG